MEVDIPGTFPPGRHSPKKKSHPIQCKGLCLRKGLGDALRSSPFLCAAVISPVVIARLSQAARKKGPNSNINCRNLKRVASISAIYQS